MKTGIRAVAGEHLLDRDARVARAERVHEAAGADRVGADVGGALEVGVLLGDAVEQLADRVDVAQRRGRRHRRLSSISIGSHRPLFIER
jgi:hypothetical protein